MKNVIFIGGGHGDKSTSLVRQLLCRHSTISPVARHDSFMIENIAMLIPYLAAEEMFYLPRVSSMKYVEFRRYIVDTFEVNVRIRQALDSLEGVLAIQSIYIPRFGYFPLVQPLTAELRRQLFSKFIMDIFSGSLANPYALFGCERTPNNAQYLPFIHEYLPRAKVVIVDRDPLYVAQSIRAVSWGSKDPVEAAHYVCQYYEQWLIRRTQVPSKYYLTIRYEDLIIDTDKILSQLFVYLELDLEQGVRDFAADLDSELNPYQDIAATESASMQAILHDVRQQLGYV